MATRKRTTSKVKVSGRAKRLSANAAVANNPLAELQRPNYFTGMLLTADDFRAEQEYFLARERRHNRFFIGWGVVSGLKVKATSPSQIVIEPGCAIDCAGNEIYVCSPVMLAISATVKPQYIALRYVETLTCPVAALNIDAAATQSEYSRIREGARLDVINVDPSSVHGQGSSMKVKGSGCGRAHALCIAIIQRKGGRLSVALKSRRFL
jgi:hypothetical protein